MFVYDYRELQDSNGTGGVSDEVHAGGKLAYRVGKRSLDFLISALALVLLIPAFALIALAIKLDSPGPVFYRQTRNGRLGQTFSILKFRSMMPTAHLFLQCVPGDTRVTKVGRFLRRTSLDELPQLINVLMGHMSLVGPRPHAIEHDREMAQVFPRLMHRYAVRPGLTGLAQIRGHRGATSTQVAIERRMMADLEYVKNASFWGDFRIMFRTVPVVLTALNAH